MAIEYVNKEGLEKLLALLKETVVSKSELSGTETGLKDKIAINTASISTLGDVKLDKAIYTTDKTSFALKTEIPKDYLTAEDIAGKLDTTTAEETYATKTELTGYIPTAEKSTFATKTEVSGKQDKFTAGEGLALEDGVLKVTVDTTLYKVVNSLPDTPGEGDENKIHLLPLTSKTAKNNYTEYIWKGDAWETLGTLDASVDLDDFLKKEEVTTVSDTEIETLFNEIFA